MLDACADLPVHQVGPRPGKEIDSLLEGRIAVIGDDADLAAVVLRMLRRDLLRSVDGRVRPGADHAGGGDLVLADRE